MITHIMDRKYDLGVKGQGQNTHSQALCTVMSTHLIWVMEVIHM